MRAVAYYRVSTSEQGRSGLGLEAQRAAVEDYLRRNGATLVAEFTEVESGARNDRPQLLAALKRAKLSVATVVIAKLDRLSRNAAFLLTLRDAGTDFVAVDMPNANAVTVGIMAVIAEDERRLISERTKAAMQAAKARGVKLGNPNGADAFRTGFLGARIGTEANQAKAQSRAESLREVLSEIQANGAVSYAAVAKALNDRHIATRLGRNWQPCSVKMLMSRLGKHLTEPEAGSPTGVHDS
jgi:DNA invertase Pin-like site-specific DNA recombinase